MSWLIVLSFFVGSIVISVLIWLRTADALNRIAKHRTRIARELEVKTNTLRELASTSLCYLSNEKVHDLSEMVKKTGERLDVVKTQILVGQAEERTLNERINEIAAFHNELEENNAEAERELANLHAQEDQLKGRLSELHSQLESTSGKISELLDELSDNELVVESLKNTNKQLLAAQEEIVRRQEMLSKLNTQYLELKRAYDSLDIEYAQLYERQSSQ